MVCVDFLSFEKGSVTDDDISGVGLLSLAKGCPKLSKVMIKGRWRVADSLPTWLISLTPNLTHLDLGDCFMFSDESFKAIRSSSSINYLNLAGCSFTDCGLGYLANGSISKTLKTLNFNWARDITDVGVLHLQKMHCLENLNLVNTSITDIGRVAISAITSLKKLSLGFLRGVSDRTIVALAQNCPNLEILDVSFCRVTRAGICAFLGHAGLQTIVLIGCEFTVSDLEDMVRGCRSLKSIVLAHEVARASIASDAKAC